MSKVRSNWIKIGLPVAVLCLLVLVCCNTPRALEGYVLFSEGSKLLRDDQFHPALSKFEAARSQFQATNNRRGEALCLMRIGTVRAHLGNYQEAINAYEASSLIWSDIDDRTMEGMALNAIGETYFSQLGQFEKGLDYLQRALAIEQTTDNLPGIGAILNSLGLLHLKLGQNEHALDYLQQALDNAREIKDLEREGAVLRNISLAYYRTGQYNLALNYLQQSLGAAQEAKDPVGEGRTLGNIGIVHSSLGQHIQALDYLQPALAIAQEVNDRSGEGTIRNTIGLLHWRLGQHEQALDYFQQALHIAGEIGNREKEGIALNNIGLMYYELRQYDQAINHLQRALSVLQDTGNRTGEELTLNNIGFIYYEQEQHDQALDYYRQALAIARDISDREGEAGILGNIGGVFESRRDIAHAIYYYQRSIRVKEAIQGDIKIEEFKASYADRQVPAYERLVYLLADLGHFEHAFVFAERARARVFLDQLGSERFDPRAGASPELVADEQDLAKQISALRHRINEGDDVNYAALKTQLETLEEAYTRILIHLKLSNPAYATLVSIDPLSIKEIRETVLDDQTTLIAYFVTDEEVIAFALDWQHLNAVSLPIGRTKLAFQIEHFRNLISVEPSGGPTQTEERTELARDLYQSLVTPLRPYLHHSRLIIIPHQSLHYLPFAALLDENLQPLATHFTISTAPSASSLEPTLINRNENAGRLLVLANPSNPATIARPIPYAEAEAKAVAAIYPQATLFIREQASEVALRNNLKNADTIHIATHSEFDPVNPLFSAILLSSEDTSLVTVPPRRSGMESDGRLEVREIFNLDLSAANLVVLSACETALGEQSRGDEIVGLSRAFLYAGTPAVVASLWPVEDEATEALMIAFHQRVRTGIGPAAALTEAQAEVRCRARWAAPYHWASFVVIGDGE